MFVDVIAEVFDQFGNEVSTGRLMPATLDFHSGWPIVAGERTDTG